MIDSPEGKYILARLRDELPAQFHYHNIDHTLDVYRSAEAIAKQETITAEDTKLLLVAALYHDCGYLQQINEHELASCNIAREALPQFGYTDPDIEKICKLIIATQLPQQPATLSEEIICDADLDYLGRNDFTTTGNKLYLEMQALDTIKSIEDWDKMQITFLQSHHYFTATSLKNREPKKQENLRDLQNKTSTLNE
jgi:HD superfamily phosphodiesterase